MKSIKDLEKVGFQNVGNWIINQSNKLEFIININDMLNLNHLLYAFEANSIVKYIGITEKTLKERLRNYKGGHTAKSGSTNKNVYSNIFDTLKAGFTVNIYILKENAPCDFMGFEISLATGIEKSLIKEFDLKEELWNIRGTNKKHIIKQDTNQMSDKKTNDILSQNETILKLGKEAMKGWLLFKQDVDKILPLKSRHMNILYSGGIISNCRFTRSDGNKKINGGFELKKYFEENFTIGESIFVKILKNNEVKIEKLNK